MEIPKIITFYNNGNTMAFDKTGRQVPELQESYLLLYCKFLKSKDVDPTKVKFILTDGNEAEVFETEDGYNWKIK